MTSVEAWEVAQAVILSLGGGAVIVGALSKWLGDLWAGRILANERATHEAHLAKLSSSLEVANRKVQAMLDYVVHIHRAQFETEFAALREVWAKVATCRASMLAVRPSLTTGPADEDDESRSKRLLQRLSVAITDANALRNAVDQQSPFYPADIYEALGAVIQVADLEALQVKTSGDTSFTTPWWDQGDKNVGKMRAACEVVSDLIRQRLSVLVVVDESQPPPS